MGTIDFLKQNLELKVIWITGASSGIGKEMALQYARRSNIALILSSRREQELSKVKSACGNNSPICVLPMDLEATNKAAAVVEKALACFGHIDLLINNAGVSQRSLIMETDIAVFERLIQINYMGAVALSRRLLPHFISRQKGQFAIVTSVMGKYGSPYRSGYCGAKHALHGFFDVLRLEHHKDGVSVTLLCPGFVQTQITVNALTGDGSQLGSDDPATANGLALEPFVKKAIRAIDQKKWEVAFGRKEKLGVYLKRFSNKLLHSIVLRSKVR